MALNWITQKNMNKSLTKHLTQTFGLCAAALSLTALPADALEISGLVKVNGMELTDVMIVAYDCSDSRELAYAYTFATDSSSGTPINFSMNVASDSVRLELYYSDTPDITPIPSWCRAYVHCGQIIPVDGKALVNVDMGCGDGGAAPGVMDHGYWKTHPDEWPVDSLTIGGRTLNKMQLMFLLRLGERGDKTLHMLRELVAAKLNVAAGNDASCVQAAIDTADGWLMRFHVGSGISASSFNWKRVMNVVNTLTDYNDGKLCAPAGEVDEDDDEGNVGIGCHRRGHKFHGWPLGWRMRR
jgi:hypothetical protein